MDRRRAERWLADVGEARFLAIAVAVAANKRPNHRPAKDTTAIVHYAALYWLTHPGLNEGQAAAAAAQEFVKRRIPGTPAVVRLARIMSEGLKKLPSRQGGRIGREAERLGLPTRASAASALIRRDAVSWAVQLPAVRFPPSPFAKALKQMAETQAGALARMLPSPAKLAKLERTQNLLAALEGLIPDDTPISHVSAMFADMVAALQEPEE